MGWFGNLAPKYAINIEWVALISPYFVQNLQTQFFQVIKSEQAVITFMILL